MTDTPTRPTSFSVGRVLKSVIVLTWRNFFILGGLALVIGFVGTLVEVALVTVLGVSAVVGRGFNPTHQASPGQVFAGLGMVLVIALVFAGFAAVLQGAIIRRTAKYEPGGSNPSFGDCFTAGLRGAGPILVVWICSYAVALVCGFFFFLFLIPVIFSIYLRLAWIVAAPSAVLDKGGPFGAFSRSMDLTSGHMWSVLGTVLVVALIDFCALPIMILLGSAMTPIAGLFQPSHAIAGGVVVALIGLLLFIVSTLAWAFVALANMVLPTALYIELKALKGGWRTDALALASTFS